MAETCRVELRRTWGGGAFLAAFAVPGGDLVARSRVFDPHDPAAQARAQGEVERALRALGWRPAGAGWARGGGRNEPAVD